MKHGKSLTIIYLKKKLPFLSTFLEVHFQLETKQFRPLSVELLNRLFLDFLNNLQRYLKTGMMKMKMKNLMNNLHIPEEMKLTRQSKKFERIRSVHRGFTF